MYSLPTMKTFKITPMVIKIFLKTSCEHAECNSKQYAVRVYTNAYIMIERIVLLLEATFQYNQLPNET